MPRLPVILLTCLSAVSLGTASLPAQSPATSVLTPTDFLEYETVAGPKLSPDGRTIVYTRRWINKQEDRYDTALWMMDADGSYNRFFAEGSSPVWSPDGARIAYLAEGEPKGSQIYVKWVDREGAPTQITRETENPSDIGWSPDGTRIAFTRFVPTPEEFAIDLPKAPEGAKWTPAPRYVTRLHYRQDRRGYTDHGNIHLFIVPADGGTPRALTAGDWSLGARFDGLAQGVNWSWSTDGTTIVADGYRGEDPDRNYRDSDIFAINVATGAVRKLTTEIGSWSNPVYSPDGKLVAYTGYPKTRASYQAEDLHVLDLATGSHRLLSAGFDRDPTQLTWAPDGRGVYFNAGDQGTVNLFLAPLTGRVRPVTTGPHLIQLGSIASSGVAAAVRTSFTHPTDIITIDLRNPATLTQLTRVNDDMLRGKRLADIEEFRYPSTGGAVIQGFLVKPPDFDPAKKYPLILEIHGGPHGMYNVAFNYFFQLLAAKGYVVLYTNPRGSTGFGSAFGNAIERAYPSVDYDDLMAGVDTAIGRGYIDDSKLYVGGCSGGGVLSSWVIGHTTRFAAAAVRCPVIDWMSFLGQTDIPYFTQNFFDKPYWEDPTRWLEQSSLMHVGKVTTPTLLMTGVLDQRTPMPQTEEYFTALQMRGVPSAILRFEGEWHGTTSKPSNFLRTVLYMVSWYQKYSTPIP
jgi:dipeptidyl aminopeptidase/acylaminoacyl peptidase